MALFVGINDDWVLKGMGENETLRDFEVISQHDLDQS